MVTAGCAQCSAVGLPIVFLGFGAIHLHNCPKEPMIPIFAIVGSVFFIIMQLFAFCGWPSICIVPAVLIGIFLFGWLIAGSVFVFRSFSPDFESRDSPEYCAEKLYEAAFVYSAAGLVFVAFIFFFIVGTLIYTKFSKKEGDSDLEREGDS